MLPFFPFTCHSRHILEPTLYKINSCDGRHGKVLFCHKIDPHFCKWANLTHELLVLCRDEFCALNKGLLMPPPLYLNKVLNFKQLRECKKVKMSEPYVKGVKIMINSYLTHKPRTSHMSDVRFSGPKLCDACPSLLTNKLQH